MPFPLLAALAPAALGLVGSLIGGSSAKKAAKQQAAGDQAAIGTMEKYLSPYSEAGANQLGSLQNFIEEGAKFSDTQAYKDIVNSAKSGGQVQSGNRMTALTDYYATNFRPERLNELSRIPEMGLRASTGLAGGIGGLQQNIGNANAAGTIGVGNALASGVGAIGGLNFSSLLNRNNLSQQTNPLSAASQAPFAGSSQQPFGTFDTGFKKYGG
jgi:hypothetical protein